MIISHNHKFIFVKPRKVAGTTIELKLSQYLKEGDYATPIEPHEEHLRTPSHGATIGKIGRQNKFGLPLKLRDHSSLRKAYLILEKKVQSYFVITACRNPWDRAVSQFFWSYRRKNIRKEDFSLQKDEFNKFTKLYGPKNWLNLFYGRKRQRRLNSSHLYTINKKLRANFAVRFEHLEKDFCTLSKVLNLQKDPMPQRFITKSTFRPTESKKWQTFYEKDTIELVRQCCAEEIEFFNYNFEGDTQLRGPHLKP